MQIKKSFYFSGNRPIPRKANRDESEDVNKRKNGHESRERIMMRKERERSERGARKSNKTYGLAHFRHGILRKSSGGYPHQDDRRKASRNVSG
jgi:hypothetical protein